MRDDGIVLEHSVDAAVALELAWDLRTDVSTWNDPPMRFTIDGGQEGRRTEFLCEVLKDIAAMQVFASFTCEEAVGIDPRHHGIGLHGGIDAENRAILLIQRQEIA